jgi:hypothetical protein
VSASEALLVVWQGWSLAAVPASGDRPWLLVAGALSLACSSDLDRTKPSMAAPDPGVEWPGTAKTGGGGRDRWTPE